MLEENIEHNAEAWSTDPEFDLRESISRATGEFVHAKIDFRDIENLKKILKLTERLLKAADKVIEETNKIICENGK